MLLLVHPLSHGCLALVLKVGPGNGSITITWELARATKSDLLGQKRWGGARQSVF